MKGISNLAQKNSLIPSQQRFDDENGANEEKTMTAENVKSWLTFVSVFQRGWKKSGNKELFIIWNEMENSIEKDGIFVG